jgi:hypothetical protein
MTEIAKEIHELPQHELDRAGRLLAGRSDTVYKVVPYPTGSIKVFHRCHSAAMADHGVGRIAVGARYDYVPWSVDGSRSTALTAEATSTALAVDDSSKLGIGEPVVVRDQFNGAVLGRGIVVGLPSSTAVTLDQAVTAPSGSIVAPSYPRIVGDRDAFSVGLAPTIRVTAKKPCVVLLEYTATYGYDTPDGTETQAVCPHLNGSPLDALGFGSLQNLDTSFVAAHVSNAGILNLRQGDWIDLRFAKDIGTAPCDILYTFIELSLRVLGPPTTEPKG